MKTETFIKRISFAYTKKNELSRKYYSAVDLLGRLKNGGRVHAVSWSRNAGRFALVDKEKKLRELLDAARIGYTAGNDAERGGRAGDYIELTNKGRQQLKGVTTADLARLP